MTRQLRAPASIPEQAAFELRLMAKSLDGASPGSNDRRPSRAVSDFLAWRLRKWAAAASRRDRAAVEAGYESCLAVNWRGDAIERRTYLDAARLLRVILEVL